MKAHTYPSVTLQSRYIRVFLPLLGLFILSLLVFTVDVSASTGATLLSEVAIPPTGSGVPYFPDLPNNQDTPLSEYVSFNGPIMVAVGGKSMFDESTNPISNETFTVIVPACSSGEAPEIRAAYLEWYQRWRGRVSEVNAVTPFFDETVMVAVNNIGSDRVYIPDEQYWAKFDGGLGEAIPRSYIRRFALTEFTEQFSESWVNGVNLIEIQEVLT